MYIMLLYYMVLWKCCIELKFSLDKLNCRSNQIYQAELRNVLYVKSSLKNITSDCYQGC